MKQTSVCGPAGHHQSVDHRLHIALLTAQCVCVPGAANLSRLAYSFRTSGRGHVLVTQRQSEC